MFRSTMIKSLALFILFSFTSFAMGYADMESLEKNLKSHVIILSDKIGERNIFNYNGLEAAYDYIMDEFKKYGYTPQIQEYFLQEKSCKNIIAIKEGKEKPDEIIIIGAHYDSVVGSPGADDNASAEASLLELARLASKITPKRTIKFIAFTNEEPPFFLTRDMGSRHYAKAAKKRRENIVAMVCLESIGYYSNQRNSQSYPPIFGLFYPRTANFIGVVGNFSSKGLVKKVKRAFMRGTDFPVESISTFSFVPGVDFSDHSSFWKYGYKAVMITDTAFYRTPYYHTALDTYEKLDYKALTEVTKGLYNVLLELSGGLAFN